MKKAEYLPEEDSLASAVTELKSIAVRNPDAAWATASDESRIFIFIYSCVSMCEPDSERGGGERLGVGLWCSGENVKETLASIRSPRYARIRELWLDKGHHGETVRSPVCEELGRDLDDLTLFKHPKDTTGSLKLHFVSWNRWRHWRRFASLARLYFPSEWEWDLIHFWLKSFELRIPVLELKFWTFNLI